MNNLRSICIICEGYEEEDYLNTLINKNIFHKNYRIKIINAKGISKLFTRYIEKFQSNTYHLVTIFCDTDKEKQTAYWELKKKIDEFHNSKIAKDIVFFGRPCTMQIFLSHFDKIELKSSSKTRNRELIFRLTGIQNYDATKEQRAILMSKINKTNYDKMKKNLKFYSDDDKICPSTNFLCLLEYLEQENTTWIDNINDKIYN